MTDCLHAGKPAKQVATILQSLHLVYFPNINNWWFSKIAYPQNMYDGVFHYMEPTWSSLTNEWKFDDKHQQINEQ